LIGYPLKNTFSEQYFQSLFLREGLSQHRYQNFPITHINELQDLLRTHPNLLGLNVTIPYKQAVIPFLQHLHPEAAAIQAVNCIVINRKEPQPLLTGYNTDVYGFSTSLQRFLRKTNLSFHQALILGNGGASKAVAYVLQQLNVNYKIVSRKQGFDFLYSDLDKSIMEQHHLIINTTPLGMHPHIDGFPPIPYAYLSPHHFCFDLIYLPEETLFLKFAKQQGAQIQNGLDMLHLQAEKAWEFFSTHI
jgi:shikimate dehydrogenase